MSNKEKLSELLTYAKDLCSIDREAEFLLANGVTISEDTDVPKKWIKLLQQEYERAKKLHFVHNPIAYALYHVWKAADADKSEVRSLDKE